MRSAVLLMSILALSAAACGGRADAPDERHDEAQGAPVDGPSEAPEISEHGGGTPPPAISGPDSNPPDVGAPPDPDPEPATLPSQVLDLSSWKLTLPVERDSGGSPREVLQPELETFSLAPFFRVSDSGDAVVFRAPAGGYTTSGSSYPRSELREMTPDGRELASWSTDEGTHTLLIEQTITSKPVVKPHVVAGQIHDADDDVVMIRLEGERLFVERGGDEAGLLDANYVLGTPMTVKLVARGGRIQVFYNDLTTPKVDLPVSASGCYFKAGAYTQSNASKGDAPDAAGEVVIKSLSLRHE